MEANLGAFVRDTGGWNPVIARGRNLRGRGCLRGGIWGDLRGTEGCGRWGRDVGQDLGMQGDKGRMQRGRKTVRERTSKMGGSEGTSGKAQEKWGM